MTDPNNTRSVAWRRILVPIATGFVVVAGATAAFASGALETRHSGADSARDAVEETELTTSTTRPDDHAAEPGEDAPGHDANDDADAPGGAPASPPNQSFVNLPDGSTQTFPADAAGSVTIHRSGSVLTVVTVMTNTGWKAETESASGAEVEVKFSNGTTRVDFDAELEDGAVRVRVRVGTEADDDGAPAVILPGEDRSGHDGGGDSSGPDSGGDDHSGSGRDGSGSGGSGSGHGGSGRD